MAGPVLRAGDHPSVPEGRVQSVAFSHDGKMLAAGYEAFNKGGIMLWDMVEGKRWLENTLPIQEGEVYSVAFSADDKTLAVAYDKDEKGGVVLWDIDLKSWQRIAGRIANRNLTREEWRRYFPEEHYYHRTFRNLPWPPDLPETEQTQAEQKEQELPSTEECPCDEQAASHSFPRRHGTRGVTGDIPE